MERRGCVVLRDRPLAEGSRRRYWREERGTLLNQKGEGKDCPFARHSRHLRDAEAGEDWWQTESALSASPPSSVSRRKIRGRLGDVWAGGEGVVSTARVARLALALLQARRGRRARGDQLSGASADGAERVVREFFAQLVALEFGGKAAISALLHDDANSGFGATE